ncbi:anti-virulence regulator CigR family protein [Morganella morganii]|uniref:anti-virulence regulator CigR family protein n=1 Tax=Morganella morganii TaxID=582 RepID=UPI0030FE4C7B
MRKFTQVCNAVLVITGLLAVPFSSYADLGNGKGHGNPHGQSKNKGHKNNGNGKESREFADAGNGISLTLTYGEARKIALGSGLTGYSALPPGIAKNLARGKPLPPGIAKKAVPASMLEQLPHYPGYEWRIAGNDLVLIAVSTAIVTSIINNVFD